MLILKMVSALQLEHFDDFTLASSWERYFVYRRILFAFTILLGVFKDYVFRVSLKDELEF